MKERLIQAIAWLAGAARNGLFDAVVPVLLLCAQVCAGALLLINLLLTPTDALRFAYVAGYGLVVLFLEYVLSWYATGGGAADK